MTAPQPSAKARKPLQRLRKICLALPETTERLSHGEPTWFVRDRKTFVMFSDHHHDDRVGFWCAAPMGAQDALVGSAPDRFFVPPYVGHRGWIGVYLDVEQDWDEIADLVEDAYRQVASKTLLVQLDGGVVTKGNSAYERLRRICLALPEVVERPFGGHTTPAFRVRDKIFCWTGQVGRPRLTVKAPPGGQEALVGSAPERFFVPDYVGSKGWVGAYLDVEQDWDELTELIEESYRLIAPKRLVALLDG